MRAKFPHRVWWRYWSSQPLEQLGCAWGWPQPLAVASARGNLIYYPRASCKYHFLCEPRFGKGWELYHSICKLTLLFKINEIPQDRKCARMLNIYRVFSPFIGNCVSWVFRFTNEVCFIFLFFLNLLSHCFPNSKGHTALLFIGNSL